MSLRILQQAAFVVLLSCLVSCCQSTADVTLPGGGDVLVSHADDMSRVECRGVTYGERDLAKGVEFEFC